MLFYPKLFTLNSPASIMVEFELTLPSTVVKYIDNILDRHTSGINILEYGTGGSTFLFSANPHNLVIACETSATWLSSLIGRIKFLRRTNVIPLYMDIGPTKEWGEPVDVIEQAPFFSSALRMPKQFCQTHNITPDLVFIDGRFRVACFLEALSICSSDALLLVDDYIERPYYHSISSVARLCGYIDRTAIFCPFNYPLSAFQVEQFAPFYFDQR
jgi:hypothetical protein